MENNTATVWQNGSPITVACGATLADALGIEAPCGGRGSCGKCKVIASGALSPLSESEKAKLTATEITNGVRLACRTTVLGDCTVLPLTHKNEQIVTDGSAIPCTVSPLFEHYGVALDIGTTTLAARLYTADGKLLATCGRINPQGQFGADVISRIEASLNGNAQALADQIVSAIDGMLCELAKKADVPLAEIDGLCITGNTAMLYLLTASDPQALSHAPFAADCLFGVTLTASEIGLTAVAPNTPVLLPPCISAFVGADTVCALLSSGMCDRPQSALLADIGTNGEVALWHGGHLTVCSTAAGPAFEGAGITMGMRGADGAIDRVQIANGKLVAHVIGNVAPAGICGSGLVDAVANLLLLEELDETGYMEERIAIADPVCLFPQDIRMLQLAKSAVCAGICTAMRLQDVTPAQLEALYVAGGFGHYLNPDSAARIGLLPRALCNKIQVVGNAALDGAAMLLLNKQLMDKALVLADSATTLKLSTSPVFAELYMAGMTLEEV